jgi:hypothetical protein
MGDGSGWTEGRVTGWIDFRGMQAICTTARTEPGDAGGPVWRWDQHGLRAAGVTVAFDAATGQGCYLPIQPVLHEWGAWLPVYGPTARPSGPGALPAAVRSSVGACTGGGRCATSPGTGAATEGSGSPQESH